MLPQEDSNTPLFILFGTVTNRGDEPLNPRKFDLKIKVNGKWLSLPENVECIFNSETQQITIKNIAKNDLQEWKEPILTGQPAHNAKKRLTTFPVISRPLLPYPLIVKPLPAVNVILSKTPF